MVRVIQAWNRRVTDVFGALVARKVGADPMRFGLATGETVACLNHLIGRGEAVVQADAKSTLWYRLA